MSGFEETKQMWLGRMQLRIHLLASILERAKKATCEQELLLCINEFSHYVSN